LQKAGRSAGLLAFSPRFPAYEKSVFGRKQQKTPLFA
jgi:hypothetical protein